MPLRNVPNRPSLALALLACGLASAGAAAHAAPIPTQITYSTTGSDVSRGPSLPVLYEFRPVTGGLATLGSDLRLGTILVHRQDAVQSMPILGTPFPIEFRVTRVGEDLVSAESGGIRIDNLINDYIRNDGTVLGNLEPFVDGQSISLQAGPLNLTLKPVSVPPTWDQGPTDSIIAVDVYARLEGVPVPEPSVLLIFASAAGLGWKRHRRVKSRRP